MQINNLETRSIINSSDKNDHNINDNNSKILCKHCKRTKENGLRCIGICVSDNDY